MTAKDILDLLAAGKDEYINRQEFDGAAAIRDMMDRVKVRLREADQPEDGTVIAQPATEYSIGSEIMWATTNKFTDEFWGDAIRSGHKVTVRRGTVESRKVIERLENQLLVQDVRVRVATKYRIHSLSDSDLAAPAFDLARLGEFEAACRKWLADNKRKDSDRV
jgi:hypothetical protein